MFYSLKGMVFGAGAVAVIGAWSLIDRATNWTPATGQVYLIERDCQFVTKGSQTPTGTKPCSSDPEWAKLRATRAYKVDGKATVKVSYIHPTTHESTYGSYKLDGRDDQFYALNAGDTVKILVSNDDPEKLRKD